MQLAELIARLPGARILGKTDVAITAVTEDSRHAGPGIAFCAVRGLRADGHDYISKAIAAGASAIIAEREIECALPVVVVADGAQALGILSGAIAGYPADELALVGITGTNGKTTCTYLIEALLRSAGRRPGVIGTVNYRYGDTVVEAPYTTPTPGILHETLREFRAASCTDAVMEVSSAALAMDRTAGLAFDVAVFTNFTQDHLELHKTMEEYRAAKARLFSHYLADDGVAVIVADDPAADVMIAAAGEHRVLRVSRHADSGSEVHVLYHHSTIAGIRATIATPRGPLEVHSKALIGDYNVTNIATAVAVGEALGLEHDAIVRGIAEMPGVPGRVERVANDRGLDILVDYAHTPDALANVLGALRPLAQRRLICVFGCGGDRDPSKRPKMGAEVAAGADLAVVTSDNPRTEEPQSILDQILPAVPHPFFVDTDRRTAITAAVEEATPGDIVIIAGKGHEDYQILGTEKIHFDDREEAARAAAGRPQWTAAQIAAETGGHLAAGDPSTRFERIVIDGRSATHGDLYVAIVGEVHDGHAFVDQAAGAGARGALVRRGFRAENPDLCLVEVDDPRAALGRIAHHHRLRWGRPIVGITGSSGKTTVKDLTAAALSAAGRVHKPKGSLNNETGVPLTLLGLRPRHDSAVIEMGMRGLGHIDYLAEMTRPTVAVVINAQMAHVGVVGSVDDIATGKSEIYRHLGDDGIAIAPDDDGRLLAAARASGRRVMTFGWKPDSDVSVVASDTDPSGARTRVTLRYQGQTHTGTIPFVGKHNGGNAACAIAAAIATGVPFADAVSALATTAASAMRGQVERVAGRNLLVDCYNANPASMAAALDALAELGRTIPPPMDRNVMKGHGTFAVVGDMLELGDISVDEHRRVGERAADMGTRIIALGEHADAVVTAARKRGARADRVTEPREAAELLVSESKPGDWILIKASRGMRLERVLEALRQLTEETD